MIPTLTPSNPAENWLCRNVVDEIVVYYYGSLDSHEWNDGFTDESWTTRLGSRSIVFNPFGYPRLGHVAEDYYQREKITLDEYNWLRTIKAVVVDDVVGPYSVQYFTDKQVAYEAWFDLLAKHQLTFITTLRESGPDALPEIEHLYDFLPLLGKAYKKYTKEQAEGDAK